MLTLRLATPADAPMLREWDAQPHVIAATGGGDWHWEDELPRTVPWREFLIAEAGGTPIGMLQVIDPAEEETHYWGDCGPNLRAIDIWIGPPEYLGQGWGTRMMQAAIARCFATQGVTAILIDPLESNLRARRFYERLGFRTLGPRRFVTLGRRPSGDDDCFVYRLDRPALTGTSAPAPPPAPSA
jgi:aminoglycoside 6'-N-acetyltransferase